MLQSDESDLLSRHLLLALGVAVVAVLAGLALGILVDDRGGTGLAPSAEQRRAIADGLATPSAVATRGSSPSVAPSASADPTTSAPDASQGAGRAAIDLSWTASAAFGEPYGRTSVHQLAAFDGGFVAVGVESANPVAPPHDEGRIWRSTDGRDWADVTPSAVLADTSLVSLFVARDGSLIAFGTLSAEDEEGRYLPRAAVAWESTDGRSWRPVQTGLPELVRAPRTVSGPLGYVAIIWEGDYAAGGMCPKMYCFFELWYSSDGRRWEHVHSVERDIRLVAGAGAEGFVVAGIGGPAGESYAFASGDGRHWFAAESPPPDIVGLAAIEGDWLILTGDSATGSAQTSAVWRSANGLDWQLIGDLPLTSMVTDAGDCRERAGSLYSAGGWLIASTGLDYPCVDVHRHASLHGRPRLSLDGTSWVTLALPPAPQTDGGVDVSAVSADGRLLLAGTTDGKATFWLGEP